MTYVVLSNGGGVGTGKCINGGNGILLDGSDRMDQVVASGLDWDVMGGVARRAWARNEPSIETCIQYNELRRGSDHITLPYLAEERMVAGLVAKAFAQRGKEK